MSNRINIPTFITDTNFTPTRVNPRLFFYNGLLDVQGYKVSYLTSPFSRVIETKTEMPYFDHYSAESGQLPTTGSNSLLFFNESPAYGSIPSQTLFTEYWSTYIELLYNPRTRLIEASAVIPLADYVDLELNDIIEWRSNHYHIRAINNYNLETGECDIELLGPIIDDAIDYNNGNMPLPTTTTTTTTTTSTTSTTSTTTTTTEAPIYGPFQSSAQQGEGQASFGPSCTTVSWPFYTDAVDVDSIIVGSIIYLNDSGTVWVGESEWYGVGTGIGAASVKAIRITNSGEVIGVESCTTTTTSTTTTTTTTSTTTTTTTASPFYAYQIAYDETNELTACGITEPESTVYSLCSTITLPGEGMCYLYNTPDTNDPVIGGYYHDTTPSGGVTKYYYTEGSNGLVQEIGTCPAPPTTTTTAAPDCQSIASSVQYSVEAGICSVTPNEITLYYTGFNPSLPEVGDTAYRYDDGCTGDYAPAGFYRVGTTGDFWIEIQSNGYIGQVVECIA